MAFRTEALRAVGGFDEGFEKLGEWCEPDVAYRLREHYLGSQLWFTPRAALFHQPSQQGVYRQRFQTRTRMANYLRFAKRWVRPCWQHTLYKLFLRVYFAHLEVIGTLWAISNKLQT